MIPPDDSYERSWEDYEPDEEELAHVLAERREFESFCDEHNNITQAIRASTKPNRQLRDANKDAKSIERTLQKRHLYDVANDTFDVPVYTDDDVDYVTVPGNGVDRDNDKGVGPLTRKDKRRMKKRVRKLERLGIWKRIWTKRGCSPRQVKGYEDRSFTPVVAAK